MLSGVLMYRAGGSGPDHPRETDNTAGTYYGSPIGQAHRIGEAGRNGYHVLEVVIRLRRHGAPARCPRTAGGHTEAVVASNVGRLVVDEKSMRLLTAMRQQLGETSASRTVDAVAAANSLGMYPGTLDRSLSELVQAGYIEESADRAMTTQGMYLITFDGIAATDNT
jgi:hypothetical protein